MRRIACHEHGQLDRLTLETDAPVPEPGANEVAIDVAAAGLNYADTLMVAGSYQATPELPFAPGLEVAGTVRALGQGVTGLAVGQRVLAILDSGGFTEVAIAQATDVFPIPDTMDMATAAGFPIAYGTAHGALVWRAQLKRGETLLVHGAAGGAGLAAVEVGKALGAQVIATAGGPEKTAIAAEHGADATIDYRSQDIRATVKELTDGQGADVVFDPVGGEVFEASMRCIAWCGRIVVIGFASGTVPQPKANHLLVKNVSVMGFYWGSYRTRAPELMRRQFEDLFAWAGSGSLHPLISRSYPLAEAGQALSDLKARKATGKLVLQVGES
ncbi:NADPH:quinone oxidoreductase family protein [Rhodovibrio salinarum]|uniref:Zinc-binding dehydrogenase n=1 Tax=Rhodovibrio salinarum TaxID=1087 RepID=A0A934QI04_9PROT|nr:NADPH:quinone oxidoreductase family protein [Rhodovibrio salinarum]MBK1696855.1 zinc-binding dehydrogenase [Rhodovibrio salinarum]